MIQKAKATRRFHFDAAHHLPNYEGKCRNVHGHRWDLEVTVEDRINENGFVLDFSEIKKIVEAEVISYFDHCDLNKLIENPTAENLCVAIWKILHNQLGLSLSSIRLYESPDSWIDYNGGLL